MDSDSESDGEIGVDSWPRFIILESTDSDKPLSKLSPFALQKGIQGLAGVPKDVNRLRSGQVLIEVDRKSHCRNLLQSNMIVDVPIRISPHKSLNFKKGIIRCRDLRGCSDDEIEIKTHIGMLLSNIKTGPLMRIGFQRPATPS